MNTDIYTQNRIKKKTVYVAVSGFAFFLFMVFLVNFFGNLPSRINGLGVLRPTVLLVALISLMLFLHTQKNKHPFKSDIQVSLQIFLVYLLLSLPLVEFAGSVIKQNLSEFIKAIVFFYFTYLIVDSRKRLNIFLAFFIGLQLLRVFEPLYLNITEGYWGSQTYLSAGEFAQRLSGAPSDIINPNELGFVIVTIIPFLHYLLMSKTLKYKILYLALLVPLLYALILTMSRGAVIALAVVGWFVFKESNKKPMLIVACVIALIVAWSQMNDIQKDRYLSLVSSDTQGASTADGRLRGIMSEFKLGFERPIVGHGVGTTPETKWHKRGYVQASHNMYGELLIETGIIGFILFLKFILSIRKSLLRLSKEENPELPEGLVKALYVVFYMYAVYSINYYGLSQYYWYMLAGLVVAIGRINSLKKLPTKAVSGKSS